MELQIKYNFVDLDAALHIARLTAEFADIIEIGSLLIYQEGLRAVSAFSEQFPEKRLYIDAKITDQPEDAVKLYANAGATYISVLAEAYPAIIKKACVTALECKVRIILDFINAHSLGQSAMDAKTLGAFGILMHRENSYDTAVNPEEDLEQIRANTDLPIFIKGKICTSNLPSLARLKPHVIVVGDGITRADDPKKEAAALYKIIKAL